MKELEYPFDSQTILKKKKSIKKQLLLEKKDLIEKRIAVLGGQTTRDIILIMELFLLNYGIKPVFYESEYNMYYEDGMFPNAELEVFRPDIIYICTCIRNITDFPVMTDSINTSKEKVHAAFNRFEGLWEHISSTYNCPIIQNNFEYPFYRLLGNRDAYDHRGRVNFVSELNLRFSEFANTHDNFYICDVNYLSACYGLDRWADPFYWHMYKYSMEVAAIPTLSFNIANIIKSIYGKNKKAFNLDLDNTLWGGIVGDDGVENIEIGQETSIAQTYSEFQEYLKLNKEAGILLTINSKNDEENALMGLNRPDSVLKPDDFVSIKANWDPKNMNLNRTAEELNLLPESFVFVDDNPAEREIIRSYVPGAAIPAIDVPEHYIRMIDKGGYFETTVISDDDIARSRMYEENAKRKESEMLFEDYEQYLNSLEMKGRIEPFIPMYMSRIAQLTNKSNQFNLTTRRYDQAEIEKLSKDPSMVTLYGKLEDKFGDNGVVSVVIGKIKGDANNELHMELWLMSCRVLKRDMEFAMMDELVSRAKDKGIKTIYGYYYPTLKNAMVKDFYKIQGFELVNEDEQGNTIWRFIIPEGYEPRQHVIKVNEGK